MRPLDEGKQTDFDQCKAEKSELKDRRQGRALLNAVWLTMRHYPLNDAFYEELPADLRPHYEAREKQ